MSNNKDQHPLSLGEFINWIKQDLLVSQSAEEDPAPFFVIDEVTVEVNFVVTGSIKGGFNFLKVVEAGSEVSEDRVQKATIRLKPMLSHDEIIERTKSEHPEVYQRTTEKGFRFYLRGSIIDDHDDTPPR